MHEIKPLTGFRFLAALYVFLFHLTLPSRSPLLWLPSFLQVLLTKGQIGVVVFFVLSGFVLTYRHAAEFTSGELKPLAYWGDFMGKRLARIYPLYLAGWGLTLAVTLYFQAAPPVHIALLSATLLQTYFPPFAMHWYDAGAWSVTNEMFFYLLFPLVLPLLCRVRSRAPLLLLLAACMLCGTFLHYWGWRGTPYAARPFQWVYSFPPSRLAEFVAGMLAALLVRRCTWTISPWVAVLLSALAVWVLLTVPQRISSVSYDFVVMPATVSLLTAMTEFPQLRWSS